MRQKDCKSETNLTYPPRSCPQTTTTKYCSALQRDEGNELDEKNKCMAHILNTSKGTYTGPQLSNRAGNISVVECMPHM